MTLQKISALTDGELEGHEASNAYAALKADGEALAAWRRYHLISDAMRDTRMLSQEFVQRVALRLEGEPTVLAPQALVAPPRRIARSATRIAAGLAAVAFVGYAGFGIRDPGPAPQLAQAPKPTASAAPAVAAAEPAPMVPSEAAKDYMLAHQGYSPRNALQGYVGHARTVSGKFAPKQ